MLPSGRAVNEIKVRSPRTGETTVVRCSLVDSANPFVFIDAASLPKSVQDDASELPAFAEIIRQKGAVLMGLARSMEEAAATRGTPKVAIVSSPTEANAEEADIRVTALSMGTLHPSLQLTGAVCLASAACTAGSVPQQIVGRMAKSDSEEGGANQADRTIRIQHAKGLIAAEVHLANGVDVDTVTLSRTARRLFKGEVCCTT
jgi:2-methylaconitate cis-trans-isomerase PrpF